MSLTCVELGLLKDLLKKMFVYFVIKFCTVKDGFD